MVVSAPCLIIGFHDHIEVSSVVGVVALIGYLATMVLGQMFLSLANRRASAILGLRIGGFRGTYPPSPASLYESWCHRHGISPYGASIEPGETKDEGSITH